MCYMSLQIMQNVWTKYWICQIGSMDFKFHIWLFFKQAKISPQNFFYSQLVQCSHRFSFETLQISPNKTEMLITLPHMEWKWKRINLTPILPANCWCKCRLSDKNGFQSNMRDFGALACELTLTSGRGTSLR